MQLVAELKCVVTVVACLVLAACMILREASDFGVHALCRATGQPSACLSVGDIVSLEQKTGYLDITRAFPNTVHGVGSILVASDAYGLRYLGNAMDCLPESFRPQLLTSQIAPPQNRRSWSEVDDYVIYPGAFVQLEQVSKLGSRFESIQAVRVEIRGVERVSVDAASFLNAIESSYSFMDVRCREALLQGGYVVLDALRTNVVVYSLEGKGNRTVPITRSNLHEYITEHTPGQFEFEANRLLSKEAKYFAIGKTIRIGSDEDDGSDLVETVARHCKYVRSCYNY